PRFPTRRSSDLGGRLALDGRVRAEDDLFDFAAADAVEQLADAKVVRPDAVHRRDVPAEHMVTAAELLGAFDRDDVPRFLDHADHRRVALRVAAEVALLAFGNVEARLA